ncbi:MAG: DHA2 family efflux MFS transporter permease subunit [Candidatus Lambdaproteobacteria bacterium]|nr:DHA2 family efflux MFS transporter permease subunit [Candidatus Lambdaproteobacteria bacterium]
MGPADRAERLRRELVLGVVMVGTFMAILDVTIVNVVIPHIMTSFGVGVDEVKWVSTAFMISQAVVMPATGWLGQRFGLGRLYIAELLVFTAGSMLCATAWSLNMLIFSRALQAVGAGGILTTSLAIITDTYPPQERGRAMGIWGVGFMVGSDLGPTLGGLLSDWFNWRSVFAVNLPIGAVALMFAAVALPPGRQHRETPFDFRGFAVMAALLVVGLLTVEYGQEQGWDSGIIQLGLAGTAALSVLFVAVMWGAPHPLLPLRLFRSLDFSLVMVIGVIRAIPMFVPLFMVPLFLQNVQGRDTLETGLLLIPSAVTQMVAMPIVGIATDRFGPRWLVVAGVAMSAACLYYFGAMDPLSGRWAAVYPQFWRGLGISILFSSVNTAGLNSVRQSDAGTASWMLSLLMSASGAVTIALLGTLLHTTVITQTDLLGTAAALQTPPPIALTAAAKAQGYSEREAVAVARSLLQRQIGQQATARAFQHQFLLMAGLTLLALLPSLLLSSRRELLARAGHG